MAARRPTNGRQVFVALTDVPLQLRLKIADRLAKDLASPTEAVMLYAAAQHPKPVRPDGSKYGGWCSKAEAARIARGLLPLHARVKQRKGAP